MLTDQQEKEIVAIAQAMYAYGMYGLDREGNDRWLGRSATEQDNDVQGFAYDLLEILGRTYENPYER